MKIDIVTGDITTRHVDAIVNAANSSLLGGGGVDGAIHRAAGPELLAACRELRAKEYRDGLPVGQAVATPGFKLHARWIIHTVGPNWHAGQRSPHLLQSAFAESLALADRLGAASIAFPAISAGVYGWDARVVARTAIDAIREAETKAVQLVEFVLFTPDMAEVFTAAA
ncbi:O-acetyl-ADP-ribose deacetylase [Sinomonas sp. ASV322]|uniref:O-acetyl-ADP-ribose deacetylase n=1 Tax=Sinomonas sp. ASV322 TaxID=3041920 RepID=UPI0027DB9BB9|nr:O-acetyl-ADP-ribose deacetylase [Sinomonas sp. ASV322]MDQ4503023.1 O-acetyl-ADP-ribose deacetylase [Sinomonas sp. ASV322]